MMGPIHKRDGKSFLQAANYIGIKGLERPGGTMADGVISRIMIDVGELNTLLFF
jgi:hypothetical protein